MVFHSPIFTEYGSHLYRFVYLAAEGLLRAAWKWRNDIEKLGPRQVDLSRAESEIEAGVIALQICLAPFVVDGQLVDPRDDPNWRTKLPEEQRDRVEQKDIAGELAQSRGGTFSALGFSGRSAFEVVYKLGDATLTAARVLARCRDMEPGPDGACRKRPICVRVLAASGALPPQAKGLVLEDVSVVRLLGRYADPPTVEQMFGPDSPLRTETLGLGTIPVGEANPVEGECLWEAEKAWLRAKAQTAVGPSEAAGAPPASPPEQEEQSGDRDDVLTTLKPAVRKAFFSFHYAERKEERRLEDREAYEWLREHGIAPDEEQCVELADYEPPAFDTWSRQLRKARKACREQKHTPRHGRPAGRSIVGGNEIEHQHGDDD